LVNKKKSSWAMGQPCLTINRASFFVCFFWFPCLRFQLLSELLCFRFRPFIQLVAFCISPIMAAYFNKLILTKMTNNFGDLCWHGCFVFLRSSLCLIPVLWSGISLNAHGERISLTTQAKRMWWSIRSAIGAVCG
jgi:hypothetical protein